MSHNTHLDLSDRIIIESGIKNGASKADIARTIGKDKSTLTHEIRNRRILSYRCTLPLQCSNYKKCTHERRCSKECVDYKGFVCNRRDRSPGACNGCADYSRCHMNKYLYKAQDAQSSYKETLHYAREGFNTDLNEIRRIGALIEPLLKQGQSIEEIMITHKEEIGVCIKTLYSYVESHLFADVGFDINVFSLRRQPSRKMSKAKRILYRKREDRSYLKGRLYSDFKNFIEENDNVSIVEMDTVYNNVTDGPFLQTFKFRKYGFLFIIFHHTKTALSMNEGVLKLEEILGKELFEKEVQLLLTDRGSEFLKMSDIEIREDSTLRTRVFYCDPMSSGQKGSLENKHLELRYILPKEHDLKRIGLTSQDKLNLVISHINSAPRKKLEGKSPIELMNFFNPELLEKFKDFGICEIAKDDVELTPKLLK